MTMTAEFDMYRSILCQEQAPAIVLSLGGRRGQVLLRSQIGADLLQQVSSFQTLFLLKTAAYIRVQLAQLVSLSATPSI